MKNYLIVVKHSLLEIVDSLPGRAWKLSDEGRTRAQQLAEKLTQFQPEVIVSSVEPKAKETAEIIAGRCNMELHIAEDLHEHERNNVSYLSRDEFQEAIGEFFKNPDALVFGSETADEAYARFYQAVQSVVNDYAGKTIIMVAHGTVISLFVSHLTGISDLFFWKELGLPAYVVLDMQTKTLLTKQNVV